MSDAFGFPPSFPERFNMADYFLDARIREGRGGRVAVKVGDRQWSYAEVQGLSNRVRHALKDRGIGLEDRVLILLPDGIDFVASWFGILKAGAVFCMGNPLSPEADLDYLLGYTRARAVIAQDDVMDRLGPALLRHPRCSVHLIAGKKVEGHESLDLAMAKASDRTENEDTGRDDFAGWLFTSGTTGKPKGAVHFHHDFPYSTECYAKGVLGLTEDDVFLSVSRLFFGYATGTNLMFPFAVGGTAVFFPDKPTPERIVEHVKKHSVTVLSNVPAMIRQMVDHEGVKDGDLASLRMCLSAGEALPAPLYERWRARGWCEILDGIGSAELFHIYITNRPGDVKLGSLGKLVAGYEAKIVGPAGNEVDDGEMGRLWIRGDSAAVYYWGDQEKSKATFVGQDWVVSADLFRKDGAGYFYYAGRGDDILKVRGMFVSPLEIEDCLSTHAAVKECAVVGALDEEGMSVPKAVVVLREGFSSDAAMVTALQEHTKSILARYKFPRIVTFTDALPRNDRGKVVRKDL